jgi:serine protease Do
MTIDPREYVFDEPPPRPTTPPVRRGFLLILFVLCVAMLIVYGGPFVAQRIGYAWEAGRSRAASEALAKLEEQGVVARASALFRMATIAVSPAVVKVQSFKERRGGEGYRGLPLGGDRFGPGFRSAELGSGVIIDRAKGYIVTNNHVVRDADHIIVWLGPGDDVVARLVGADPKTDLAVVQVHADLKVQAEWGDSEKLDNGDWVLAIGSPLGLDHSVTAGIISATERNDLQINEYESFIQTDAAINPGNSGGPLIDLSGKVVGINTAILSQSGGYEGIGLAIPSSLARRVAEHLIKEGRVSRGYLGVRLYSQTITAGLARQLSLPSNQGALIVGVQPESPADRAGLKSGDVIVKLADRDVADRAALRNLAAGLPAGTKVSVTYFREGRSRTSTLTVEELPAAPEVLALGFRVRSRPSDAENQQGGVEIDQVDKGGPAFREGLRPGMRIVAVGQTQVKTLTEFEVAVRKVNLERGLPLIVETPDGRVGNVIVGAAPTRQQP